jgi:hypothetical protein
MVAEASGVMASLAWLVLIEAGTKACWTWSSGPNYVGSTSLGGVPIKELVRRTGLARNTVRAALRSDEPSTFHVQPDDRTREKRASDAVSARWPTHAPSPERSPRREAVGG